MKKITNDIYSAWATKKNIIYNNAAPAVSIFIDEMPKGKNLSSDVTVLHWTNLLEESNSVLEKIEDWYLVDDIFNYFFPALLIYFLKKSFKDDEVLFFFMERVGSSTLNNHSDFFCRLMFYSLDKIDSIERTLNFFENKKMYEQECKALKLSIEWVRKKEVLKKEIFDNFPVKKFVDISQLFDVKLFGDHNYSYLQRLLNVTWWDIVKEPDLLKIIDYDIMHIKDDSLIYFLPAYIISSLDNMCNDESILEFCLATIGNSLEYIGTIFFEENKNVVINYLNLILISPISLYQREREIKEYIYHLQCSMRET